MKLNIERPDAFDFCEKGTISIYDDDAFHKWFTANVEPINKMLADAVEVYSDPHNGGPGWHCNALYGSTQKALLINVGPIVKETAEDVLKSLLLIVPRSHSEYSAIVERAKAVLENK